ncbi:disease resistance protein RUN1-like [Eucalyptus grandis]|uniref:disease resistance protein RUN1-like n=1 Tax=Eucalyptus grandis TaxID=71139 RepID=UPI00192EFAA7|nr:disease resistance protein RUN1-like [Eucalyptus grandis]
MAAAIICECIRRDFECFVFLDKIGEADRVDILGLQKKLLHNLMKVEGLRTYGDIQTNINEINSNMCFKRILLVLDNVTSKEQIDYFWAGDRELLCPGSRILITTRDQNLLKDLKVDDKYIVKGLDPNEALRLFRRHAWKREEPQEGYEELSRNLAHYAGGHSLSLKWLGSFLNGMPKQQWPHIMEKLVRSPYLDSLIHSSESVGPYGGQGGDAFEDGTHNGLVTLDHQYLISVSGHIDDDGGHDVVRSLKIHSNKKTYGPFGAERGRPFDLSHSGRQIIGFHGKCCSHLHSIGAHFGPISHVYPYDVVGPFGGDSGMDIWDDGKHTDVRQVVVGFDSSDLF